MRTMKAGMAIFLFLSSSMVLALSPDNTQLSVWANEAIVGTYSFDYKNYLQRQQQIAKYFSADGWIAYTKALSASKLPETVVKNAYFVNAVATLPPEIKPAGDKLWQATMPLLVTYKNPQYQQKQTLNVTINFGEAPSGQGVRGLYIKSLLARIAEPACECAAQTKPDAGSPSPNEKPAETTTSQ